MLEIQERNMMNGERFHAGRTRAVLSPAEITAAVRPGDTLEDSFIISDDAGGVVSGFVLSSQPPMHVLTPSFTGTKEIIGYRLNAEGFAAGESVDGLFRILTNLGEYELPFHVRIEEELPASGMGQIRSLHHFVNLARTNWKEAASLFYRKEFEALTADEEAGGSKEFHTLWRGLSSRTGNEHNVEEFLIAAGLKDPAVYETEYREITADLSRCGGEAQILPIRIRRKGWGYTGIQVRVSGDCAAVSQRELKAEDFSDGTAVLSLTLDPARMHAGRNYAQIVLTPDFGEPICLQITASRYVDTAVRSMRRREQRELTRQLTQDYLTYRAGAIGEKEFTERMGSLVRRMQEADRLNPFSTLYRIHYLLAVHEGAQALWELQALCRRQYGLDGPMPDYPMAQFDLEDDLAYSYRIYLTILCAKEVQPDTIEAAGIARDGVHILENMHRRNPDHFRIAWLMLDANPDYSRRPSEVLRILKEQYARGSRSPLLYMELWQMISMTPTILYELGDLELQILLFAARRGILTDSVMVRVNDLAVRRKTFSRRLYRILTMAYEVQTQELRRKETLGSICTLLIRGNMTDSRYHVWYRRGVEQELNITRLLDYYMLSLPAGEDEPLPQIIMRYYSYQTSLPDVQTARLYRCIAESREDNPELYAAYTERIDRFTLEQLSRRRISDDLAYLYERCLDAGRILSAEHAASAVMAVFTCRIHTTKPGVHRAVLVYDEMRDEQYCPLSGGTGYMPVYGDGYRLFLENDRGDRWSAAAPGEVERLMDCDRLAPPLVIYEVNNPGFDLYLADRAKDLSAAGAKRRLELAVSRGVAEPRRALLRRELTEYYEKTGDAEALGTLLARVEPDGIGAGERAFLIRAMAVQGRYGQAYTWLVRFGTGGVDAGTLLRLVSGIRREKIQADPQMLAALAYDAFRQHQYDIDVLQILVQDLDAGTKELEQVRKAALGFDLDTSSLARRMLVQLLFTGESFSAGAQLSGENPAQDMEFTGGSSAADMEFTAEEPAADMGFAGEDPTAGPAFSGRSALIESCAQAGAEDTFLADVLAQMSHFCFVYGEKMPRREFDRIARFGMDGVPLLDICRIAWLKDRSERSGETSDYEAEVTELFLNDLIGRNVVFPFYRQFPGTMAGLLNYADETLFEYRAGRPDPKARVLFHYAAERGGIREPYAAKEMKEMYEGVYVTGFLLFFGEQLHYYITDDAQEKNIVESGTLSQDARIAASGEDRFCCINEITMLTALGRDEEAIAQMDEYGRKAFLTSRLFED